tara:strand:+ start:167 stop:304 length:138 start_codon:yes stop_codon:yes gene_type:complete
MLTRDIKKLLDLLLVTENDDDRITIYGAIQFKLKTIREILDGKVE